MKSEMLVIIETRWVCHILKCSGNPYAFANYLRKKMKSKTRYKVYVKNG